MVSVTSAAMIALPGTGTTVRPVRPTFSALIAETGPVPPSVRSLACAVTVDGRPPAWVSTIVMPLNVELGYWPAIGVSAGLGSSGADAVK